MTKLALVVSVGWLAACPVCAQVTSDAPAVPGVKVSLADSTLVSLKSESLGAYWGARNASGTAWQPESSNAMLNDQAVISRHSSTASRLRDLRGDALDRFFGTVMQGDDLNPRALVVGVKTNMDPRPAYSLSGIATRRMPLVPRQFVDVTGSYPLAKDSALFGYVGIPGEPALGPPVSYMRRYAGFDAPDPAVTRQWLDASQSTAQVFTVGYVWRDVKLESSAFSQQNQEEEQKRPRNVFPRLDSRSARLSFNPSADWSFQLSRGLLSGLDQIVSRDEIKRSSLSATYNRPFSQGNWQTTLAWGRSSRKNRESMMGYLLESTVRFGGNYAMFGRVEQVASDELMRENESIRRQLFKMNKVTVGYFQEVQPTGSFGFDVGAFVSRHLVPSDMHASYGKDPTAYMMFVRLKLR